ncbi:hypothetical protein Nlim_0949 [Candidatus Nitrosarchaeum limnium SFB1]|jgi:hypothetical protein|uniref:Roadblock/LAMTOR2 domain-containing protein n=1 Tax=Candidatus Nitrosarchaeum limnium SFB1 TaxID=886738 RepID=F3KKD4_9ARCH|nr:hypothetical protein Nlim_0949 [Candidatus Nitrosarchaeum limnium SFB1]
MLKQLTFKGGIKQLTCRRDLKSTLDINENIQLENKCRKLLKNDEIRFVGMINPMGNLIFGGFNKYVDLFKNNEKRRQFYMQMALEISMRKDFDDVLGKINHITTNRDNILMIAMPINNHVLLIYAKPTATAEHLIAQVNVLGFSNLRLE